VLLLHIFEKIVVKTSKDMRRTAIMNKTHKSAIADFVSFDFKFEKNRMLTHFWRTDHLD
jgi:hypothetical protein